MTTSGCRYLYGPVPSRRLGRSLGVDLVPLKTCTYDCIYCQLGRTTNKTTERKEYVPIEEVLVELKQRLALGPVPDYVSLAGSGEPTLNSRIGELIGRIKMLTDIPVAVLSNSSLLWMRQVQDALMEADLVLPSLDAGDAQLFRNVNRPHKDIDFEQMTEGLITFRERFHKQVWLEVFLLAGVTGIAAEVRKIAAIADRIRPDRVQLNTVSRPPAEEFASQVSEDRLKSLASFFSGKTEVIGESGVEHAGSSTPNGISDEDLLALLSRRPCTLQDVSVGLGLHINEAAKRLAALCERGLAIALRNNKDVFYEARRRAGVEHFRKKEERFMRIAIPLADGKLAPHFGHCERFALIDVDPPSKTILKREDIEAPPHQPGLLPPWLAERGVQLIIAGGMGQRARGLFGGHDIQVVVGAPSETPERLAADYLAGTLQLGANICDH
jgi:wyosine [tRNA(Phe)-imidazoG37] synthetase (radical SAM superfamily)/predicted Fe-Mo cluster-binding NifX family protein